jgi:hypothetical protein
MSDDIERWNLDRAENARRRWWHDIPLLVTYLAGVLLLAAIVTVVRLLAK